MDFFTEKVEYVKKKKWEVTFARMRWKTSSKMFLSSHPIQNWVITYRRWVI